MNDHFLAGVAALKDFMAARERGEFNKVAALQINGHFSLFGADMIDGQSTPIGESEAVNEASNDLRRICESITGRAFPKVPIGSPRGRNGEILRLALPIILKYLLPLLIAEAGPAIASAALLSLIDN